MISSVFCAVLLLIQLNNHLMKTNYSELIKSELLASYGRFVKKTSVEPKGRYLFSIFHYSLKDISRVEITAVVPKLRILKFISKNS